MEWKHGSRYVVVVITDIHCLYLFTQQAGDNVCKVSSTESFHFQILRVYRCSMFPKKII